MLRINSFFRVLGGFSTGAIGAWHGMGQNTIAILPALLSNRPFVFDGYSILLERIDFITFNTLPKTRHNFTSYRIKLNTVLGCGMS